MGADYTVGGLFVNWPIVDGPDATKLHLSISRRRCHCAARKIFLDRRRIKCCASDRMDGARFGSLFVPKPLLILGDMH